MDDNDIIMNAENYRGDYSEGLTYEAIVLKQIQRCVDEGSKEMIGGYTTEKMTARGPVQVRVPDQKQVYIQCIDVLHDLLLTHFDETMNKVIKQFDKDEDAIFEDKMNKLKKTLESIKDKPRRDAIQRQIDSKYLDNDSLLFKEAIDEKVQLYRGLFRNLLLLYHRIESKDQSIR